MPWYILCEVFQRKKKKKFHRWKNKKKKKIKQAWGSANQLLEVGRLHFLFFLRVVTVREDGRSIFEDLPICISANSRCLGRPSNFVWTPVSNFCYVRIIYLHLCVVLLYLWSINIHFRLQLPNWPTLFVLIHQRQGIDPWSILKHRATSTTQPSSFSV